MEVDWSILTQSRTIVCFTFKPSLIIQVKTAIVFFSWFFLQAGQTRLYPITRLVAHTQPPIHCDIYHELFLSVLLLRQLILSVWGNPTPGVELCTSALTTVCNFY